MGNQQSSDGKKAELNSKSVDDSICVDEKVAEPGSAECGEQDGEPDLDEMLSKAQDLRSNFEKFRDEAIELEKNMSGDNKSVTDMLDAVKMLSTNSNENNIDSTRTFESFEQGIKNLESMYDFYDDLRKNGVTKNSEFQVAVTFFLSLCHKQFRLLDKTSDVLQQLIQKCELVHFAIQCWGSEGENASKDTIDFAIKELQKWILNRKEIHEMQQDWLEFKEETEKFALKWDEISPKLIEHLKDSERGKLSKFGQRLILAGKSGVIAAAIPTLVYAGFGLACMFAPVAVGALAVIGMAVSGTISMFIMLAASKARRELNKKISKHQSGVNEITAKLKTLLAEAKDIENEWRKLENSIIDHAGTKDVLQQFGYKPHMWKLVKPKLYEIDESLQKFKADCKQLSQKIWKSRREMAKRK